MISPHNTGASTFRGGVPIEQGVWLDGVEISAAEKVPLTTHVVKQKRFFVALNFGASLGVL
jgi:hypothetical protein